MFFRFLIIILIKDQLVGLNSIDVFLSVVKRGEYDLGAKSPWGKITSPQKLLYELGVKKCSQGRHCQFGVNI